MKHDYVKVVLEKDIIPEYNPEEILVVQEIVTIKESINQNEVWSELAHNSRWLLDINLPDFLPYTGANLE